MKKTTSISLIFFSLFLLFQPGFNRVQQYELVKGTPSIRPAPIDLPKEAMIPLRSSAYTEPPFITAQSAMIIDKESGAILYEKNPDTLLYPASITKMMTALVSLESYSMDDLIIIQEESRAIGNTINLQYGEVIRVEQLLKGLLIASGNDAAYALAQAYPTGYDGFVERMNQKAKQLHLNHTVYKNVSGVEQEGHLTTVRDIATLTKSAIQQEFFRETVQTKSLVISDESGDITHKLYSTNQLLGVVPGVRGIKTGWTTQAGECLVTLTSRDNHDIIVVVLNSKDRFGESTKLIEWAFSSHEWNTYYLEDDGADETADT